MVGQRAEVSEAMKDLAAVRDAIDPIRREKRSISRRETYIVLQSTLLMSSIGFVVVELIWPGQMNDFLSMAAGNREIFWWAVAFMAVLLSMISGLAILLMARSAKLGDEDFLSHIDRNFRPFSDLSLFSDLTIKLVVLSAFLAVGKSIWVAPLLFLFTSDFLLQRRLIQIPRGTAVGLAIAGLIAGVVQFSIGSSRLLWPLIGFSIITLLALVRMVRDAKDPR